MNEKHLKEMLDNIKSGKMSVEDGINELKILPYEDLGYAKVDFHRSIRTGYPEVIFCQGKRLEHIVGIFKAMLGRENNIMATRADEKVYKAVKEVCADAIYYDKARIVVVNRVDVKKTDGTILVATGGTADIEVAEEAAVTAEILGNTVDRLYDVGVAGIHRLLMNTERLSKARVIIVAAGMEGALASVIGGLVNSPVIAVPTSVGYGANFHGLSALLTMLNSCASGIGVVNIDNGFGAGYLASMINKIGEKV